MAKVDPKVTALLLGMPKGAPSDEAGDDEDADVGKSRELDASKAILKAVEEKDPEALSEALREHYDACESKPEGEESGS